MNCLHRMFALKNKYQFFHIFICTKAQEFKMWLEVNLQVWLSYYTRRISNENLTLGMQIRHGNGQQTFPSGCCLQELERLWQPHASDQGSLHTRMALLSKHPTETNGPICNEFQWRRDIEVFYSGCRDSSILWMLDQKFHTSVCPGTCTDHKYFLKAFAWV